MKLLEAGTGKIHFKAPAVWICLAILAATIAVYFQVADFDFINFDDDLYVYNNPLVKSGVRIDSIREAFRFSAKGGHTYYHPLTTISHMLDYQLFGLSAGWHHLVNLLFHLLNVFLLFILLQLLTNRTGPSAFAAALFALHPINVESVVWIAERKNLLSTFFWIITILFYVFFVQRRTIVRFLAVFFSMLLGLTAKPFLITLPFVLLLLDYWPLGRLKAGSTDRFISRNRHLIIEKIPLFLLTIFWTWLSIDSNKRLDFMVANYIVPMDIRCAVAITSYLKYLGKMLWPFNLAVYYPYPAEMPPVWQIVAAGLSLAGITFAVLRSWKTRPWLTLGWFWYLGTLFPVIGITQNGLWPELADRWAYVPLIGIYIALIWDGAYWIETKAWNKKLWAGVSISFLVVTCLVTIVQASYWKNSIKLFSHALRATERNFIAYTNLAQAILEENKEDLHTPLKYLLKSLQINASFIKVYHNLAFINLRLGRYQEAINYSIQAIKMDENHSEAHLALGLALAARNNISQAVFHLRRARQLNPESYDAAFNLAIALEKTGYITEAIELLNDALQIKPDSAEVYNYLGRIYCKLGKLNNAMQNVNHALSLNPTNAMIHNTKGNILQKMGKDTDAILQYQQALEMSPNLAEAHNNIGAVMLKKKNLDQAIYHFEKALAENPAMVEVKKNLGDAFFLHGDVAKAIEQYREVVNVRPDLTNTRELLAGALQVQKQLAAQIKVLAEKSKTVSDDAGLLFQLGKLNQQAGKPRAALENFKRAMILNPNSIVTLNAMVLIYAEKGEYQPAIDLYENYLTEHPKENRLYYNIACLYARQGDTSSAVKWLGRALEKGYSNWPGIKKDYDLTIVRTTPAYHKLAAGYPKLQDSIK